MRTRASQMSRAATTRRQKSSFARLVVLAVNTQEPSGVQSRAASMRLPGRAHLLQCRLILLVDEACWQRLLTDATCVVNRAPLLLASASRAGVHRARMHRGVRRMLIMEMASGEQVCRAAIPEPVMTVAKTYSGWKKTSWISSSKRSGSSTCVRCPRTRRSPRGAQSRMRV